MGEKDERIFLQVDTFLLLIFAQCFCGSVANSLGNESPFRPQVMQFANFKANCYPCRQFWITIKQFDMPHLSPTYLVM